MVSWNVVWLRAREYELLNGCQTTVKLSPSSKFNVLLLMSRMDNLGVPVRYTEDLREIVLTQLRDGDHGDYFDSRIRISSDRKTRELMERVFVHELAHHVDDMSEVTDDPRLEKERKSSWKHMPDKYARKNVSEYLAVGFEVYYCGTYEEKRKMSKKNPVLYSTIRRLHRQHGGI